MITSELPLNHKPCLIVLQEDVKTPSSAVSFPRVDYWSLALMDFSGAVTVDGRTFAVNAGSLALYPRGSTRQYRFDTAGLHRVIHFAWDLPHGTGGPEPFVIPAGDGFPHLAARFNKLRALQQESLRRDIELWGILWDGMACLWRYRDDADGDDRTLGDIRSFVKNNLDKPLTVRFLADSFSFSSTHLTRLFKQAGLPAPAHYIRQKRAERVGELIKDSALSLKEIAFCCGFDNLQGFNRFCRKHLGKAPRGLRRECQS